MRKRFRIPVLLMLAAMLLIIAFQAYWLHLNYVEERRNLRFRTNLIFRETLFELQASKLNLDSSIQLRYKSPSDIARFGDVVRARVSKPPFPEPPDSKNRIITYERLTGPYEPDTMKGYVKRPDAQFFNFLISIDSLQDSIKVSDIGSMYQKNLLREKIATPFQITRTDGEPQRNTEEPNHPEWNKMTIGFKNPVTYQLDLVHTWPYLMNQIKPQIIFSVFLVGLTLLAFVVLYRNLLAQQRLTLMKNEFIGNITHELKTPISTVSVAIEAMKNFNALQDPLRTREYLDIAGNELRRLSLLVDKVLKLSMFEKDQTELRFERFDMKYLVEEVLDSMKLQFEKYKAEVAFHSHGSDLHIEADRLHITSVIYNLFDNALKYSRDNPKVDVDLDSDGREITLRVKDNGIGIPAEYRSRIFEKFFRVPAGNTHNTKGYGLGLSYTAHIVKQHHGSISVHSEPGAGSEFIVKLPVQHEENPSAVRGR